MRSIFDKIHFIVNDDYVSKFKVYCMINLNKSEEAQLHFDLLQESGFEDVFFEKKFNFIMGYSEKNDPKISDISHFNDQRESIKLSMSRQTAINAIIDRCHQQKKNITKMLSNQQRV